MRPLVLLAIGLQLFEPRIVAAEEAEAPRPFVTLPFSARPDQETGSAFESAAKQHGSILCGLSFPQNEKRCERADIRWSEVSDIISLRSDGSGTLFSATVDIAKWARRLGIPALPDDSPMIATAGASPRFAATTEDITIVAAPGSFRPGETIGAQRIKGVHESGSLRDPAEAKISAIQAWRRDHPHQPDLHREILGRELSEPQPRSDRTSVKSLTNSDERISGMRW